MTLCPVHGSPLAAMEHCTPSRARLWKSAQQLESAFLSEMIGQIGLGGPDGSRGEGSGQFDSFLHAAYADRLVQKGGIGLAQMIFTSLARRDHEG